MSSKTEQKGNINRGARRVKDFVARPLHYYPKTDGLYIEVKPEPYAEAREITDGPHVDLSAEW